MRQIRIMVVDDEPGVAAAIAALLEAAGHDVTSAISGEDALELLDGDPIDLVISDLVMPGMSGVELHQQLVARDSAPFRFVLMSGTARAVLKQVVGAAAGGVLAKPVSADQLRGIASDCARAIHAAGA